MVGNGFEGLAYELESSGTRGVPYPCGIMLPSLLIRNFRSLRRLEVPTLGQVNLIVGKNNCGKSTVLEALRIYAQQGARSLLDELLASHDEFLPALYGSSPDGDEPLQVPYQNFFHGRTFPTDDSGDIYVGNTNESKFVKLAFAYFRDERIEGADNVIASRRVRISRDDPSEDVLEALHITSDRRENPRWIPLQDQPLRPRRTVSKEESSIPAAYVPTGLLASSMLADLWDSIALTNLSDTVLDGLRIIVPELSGLAFVRRHNNTSSSMAAREDRAAVVSSSLSSRPVPLNSMGDGMTRLLQLLLCSMSARNGMLLIDEFENGLHYSVQEDVWRVVCNIASRSNIQIFATTHSWDCVSAFRNVATTEPIDAVLFRLGRSVRDSDRGATIATTFAREELVRMAQSDLELR